MKKKPEEKANRKTAADAKAPAKMPAVKAKAGKILKAPNETPILTPYGKAPQKVRINKYLAEAQYASRRGADELIRQNRVIINGRPAVLGDSVGPEDKVEVKKSLMDKAPIYIVYNKPVGVVTHSPQKDEVEISTAIRPLLKGELHNAKLFPIGRLDKDSHGLIIMTDDGRITGKLLDPEEKHEKEYVVEVKNKVSQNFQMMMERGVSISDDDGGKYKTKRCIVHLLGDRKFSITLTEGKKRQIRRMCEVLGNEVTDLNRIRIMDINLGYLSSNNIRRIKGEELDHFLEELGVRKKNL